MRFAGRGDGWSSPATWPCRAMVALSRRRNAERPAPQEILRDWYYLMNELVRHTATYSPPVASRSFGYLGVTAFEAAVGGSDKLVSLAGQLHGLEFGPGARGRRRLRRDDHRQRRDVGRDRLLFRQYRPDRAALDQDRAEEMARAGRRWHARRHRGAQRGFRQGRGRQHPRLVAATMAAPSSPIWDFPERMGVAEGRGQVGADQRRSASSSCRCCRNGATSAPLPLPSGATCATPGNPTFSTEPDSQFYKEADEVYETGKNATPEQIAIARFWSDDPMLSMTPPGHWVSIALQVAERADLSLDDNVDLLARMGVALSDAFVGCWHEKYHLQPRSPDHLHQEEHRSEMGADPQYAALSRNIRAATARCPARWTRC